jgi:SNF2 family DNA or RNA helicase
MFNKKLLKSGLKEFFESHIFSRGVKYYNDNSVEGLKIFSVKDKKKIEIRGEVAGRDYYNASMFFDLKNNKFNGLDCDCPYYDNCKHLAALGLEFIDLLEELAGENADFDMDKNYREKLINWINKQEKAKNYKGYGDEGRGDDDVEDDDAYEDEDDVMEGEFEEINNQDGGRYKNMSKEELLGELKNLIDIGDAPDRAVDGIIYELALRGADYIGVANNKNKTNSKNLAMQNGNKKQTVGFSREYNINDYYIVVDTGYNNNISVNIKKNKNSTVSAEVCLNNCRSLTEKQKELLQFLKKYNSYYAKTNHEKLFALLNESGLKVYWEDEKNEIKFLSDSDGQKIKVSLSLKNIKDKYDDKIKKEFIFKLDESYKNKKMFAMLFDQEGFAVIDNYEASFYKIPASVIKILSRINIKDNYHAGYDEYKKQFETALNEDEIIKINNIIKDCNEYLDFTSELKPNFKITEFTEVKPCMLADYNSKKDILEVRAAVDYGVEKINVGESVYRDRRRGQDEFSRMSMDKYVIKISENNIDYALANKEKEIELYKFFCYSGQEYGFKRNVTCRWEGEKEIFKYFAKHWENIKNLGHQIIFVRDEFSFAKENFRADFNVDLNAENDWLWFDVNCYGGEDKISLEDLRKYVEDKKEFIKMNGGRMMKIANFEELERFIMMLESFYAREQGGFEGKLYHAPELENIFTNSKYYSAKVEDSFNKFIKEAKSGKPVKKVKLKPEFNKIMRAYQKEGVDWFYFLRQYRFAGVLADDMGLGKTLQALVLVEKEKIKNKPSIVVCPKSILYNWELEAKKFAPKLKTAVVDGLPAEREKIIKNAKKIDLIITGYATMKKDAEIYEKNKIKFNYCILDEAQFIKNHATKNARIMKKINADYRLALTGTPLENSVSEIWSIFDFLMPGFLGSYKAFVKKFQNPIMKYNSAAALEHLRKKVECFMLRRTKGEVLKELPPKVEQVSHCHLEKAQNILYQEILANVKSEIFATVKERGFNQSRIHILAGLTKLRQVCNHPALLLKDKNYVKYESAKLNMFMELMDEIIGNKRKVLVFSQFTKMLDILAEELKKNKIDFNYLSGQTKNRQGLVDDFNNNSGKRVFLISIKAGGTGLNLTSADNVIIFDPWWNPSVENQAIDRAHRIGQKNSVNVYRLITLGTIEEKIVKLQERKKFLFDNLVGESKNLFQKLTWEDVKELFK